MTIRVLLCILLLLGGSSRPARAQWGVWYADSLLAEGRISSAEAAYYAASRARPRDPVARAALGRYLAARGATRVGAVLLEEARDFGGDSVTIAAALAPLYERLADYTALAALRPNVLSSAERRRAEWLRDRPLQVQLPDSVVVLTYRPSGDGSGFGTVLLRIGRAELPAKIDPQTVGLVLPSTFANEVRQFGRESERTLAVASGARLGPVTLSNVPVSIGAPDEQVRIGFDMLAPYSPAFDPRKGILTLRQLERRSRPHPGPRIPALYDNNSMRLLLGGRWQPTTAAMTAMLLATRAWMWDTRRGDIVLLP